MTVNVSSPCPVDGLTSPVEGYVARGRRPFLLKKLLGQSQDERTERNEDSWEARTNSVREWMRCNPLHLGVDDEAVELVKKMLYKGKNAKSTAEADRCWAHIVIEMAHVPGTPISESERRALFGLPQKEGPVSSYSISLDEADPESSRKASSRVSTGRTQTRNDDGKAIENGPEIQEPQDAMENLSTGLALSDIFGKGELANQQPSDSKESFQIPHGYERRNTEGDAIHNTDVQALNRRLTEMSLLERQNILLAKKKIKAERLRLEQLEKEAESCTHRPQKFSRRGSFDNVESLVDCRSPAKSPCKSPSKRMQACDEMDLGNLSQNSLATISIASSAKQQPGKVSFLEECRTLLGQHSSSVILPPSVDQDSARTKESFSLRQEQDGAKHKHDAKPREAISKRTRSKTPATNRRKSSLSRSRTEEMGAMSSGLLSACKADLDKVREEQQAERVRAEREEHARRAEEEQRLQAEREREEQARAADLSSTQAPAEQAPRYRFANNSTVEHGKVELQDYNEFALDSFYRKRDRGSSKPGVSLLMGRREDDNSEQVVAVIFDKSKFDELQASEWVALNLHRFKLGRSGCPPCK